MKKTDIAMIILIASLSVIAAYSILSIVPALNPSLEPVKVKTAKAYTSHVDDPDPTIFNSDAINPTVNVTVGKQ